MVEHADEVILYQVTTCQSCSKYLGSIPVEHHEKRQVFDGAAGPPRPPFTPLSRCMSVNIITAKNACEENIYVQNVSINGAKLNSPFVQHKDIQNGGKIEFMMGKEIAEWGFLNLD